VVDCCLSREQTSRSTARASRRRDRQRQVIAYPVPISRENYHAPACFWRFLECLCYAGDPGLPDRSEQALLTKVGISSGSA
jgi:hypothetical protein